MTDKPWSFDSHQSSGREGDAPVPGGMLRYRLAGATGAKDVVVIESGWSAPFPYAVWLEEALAPHVRVLSYDRAGIGDSRSSTQLTPPGMTRQLTALLAGLGIDPPVVVVGHSYGGLIGALHAAQAPTVVRAIVQIDPTPEFNHELVDASMGILPLYARLMQLCALLKIDGPLFLDLPRELPPEIFKQVKRNPRWLARSFNGAIAELRLLGDIRRTVTASEVARQCPRLVLSGTQDQVATSWLQKLLVNEEKSRKYWDAVHELHRRQASLNPASRWMKLPYGHVNLVTRRASAGDIGAHVLGFISRQ